MTSRPDTRADRCPNCGATYCPDCGARLRRDDQYAGEPSRRSATVEITDLMSNGPKGGKWTVKLLALKTGLHPNTVREALEGLRMTGKVLKKVGGGRGNESLYFWKGDW
jgi:transcription initiation factor IIE alpha subunit